jgi:hypothetical protein
MPQTYILLGADEHSALIVDALAELRPPREHARYLLREILRERGRLREEPHPTPDSRPSGAEAINATGEH